MGELNPVMNGVEFRTRHNDYKLRMPHTSKGDYHAYENIPFPDVPPSVKSKRAVEVRSTPEESSLVYNYCLFAMLNPIGIPNRGHFFDGQPSTTFTRLYYLLN